MSTMQHARAANSQGYKLPQFWEMGCAWEVLLLLVQQLILVNNSSFFSHSLDGGMKQESKGTLQQDFSLGCLHWKPICTPSLKPEGRLDYSKCRCLVRAGPPTREGRLREESCGVLPLAQLFSEE